MMKKPKKPTLQPAVGQQAKFRAPVAVALPAQPAHAAPKSSTEGKGGV